VQSVEYQGFRITPEPMKEAQGYRLCAVIEKEVDGALLYVSPKMGVNHAYP